MRSFQPSKPEKHLSNASIITKTEKIVDRKDSGENFDSLTETISTFIHRIEDLEDKLNNLKQNVLSVNRTLSVIRSKTNDL